MVDEPVDTSRRSPLVMGSISAEDTNGWPRWVRKKWAIAVGEGQLGDVDVQIHPVDALELHGHMLSEDIGGAAG